MIAIIEAHLPTIVIITSLIGTIGISIAISALIWILYQENKKGKNNVNK